MRMVGSTRASCRPNYSLERMGTWRGGLCFQRKMTKCSCDSRAARGLGLCVFRLQRDFQARTRRFGVTLKGTSGGLGSPTFQPSNNGLSSLHALRHLLLGQTSAGARLNQSGDKRELHSQRSRLAPVLGALHPVLVQVIYTDTAHCSFTSCARFNATSISRRGVFRVFFTNTRTTTTRRPFAVSQIALEMPSLPFMRISHKGPSRCFTCGSRNCSRPPACIRSTNRRNSGFMSAGG